MLFIHPTARIVSFNEPMVELCGYRQLEVVGLDWFDCFVPEREREYQREQFERTMSRDAMATLVCPLVTRAGAVRQIEWGINRVHDSGGVLLGLMAVGQDITEKLALRAKLAETDHPANIGLMASLLCDELEAPLGAIRWHAQLLRQQLDSVPVHLITRRLDAITFELARLSTTLDSFRDASER